MKVVRPRRRSESDEPPPYNGPTRALKMANMLVEISPVCPKCQGGQFYRYGNDGPVIYRKCQECGHCAKCLRVRSSEVVEVIVAKG